MNDKNIRYCKLPSLLKVISTLAEFCPFRTNPLFDVPRLLVFADPPNAKTIPDKTAL